MIIGRFHPRSPLATNRTVFQGNVEAYDETPSYSDGAIIFKVSGKLIDVGGGLRADSIPTGSFDERARKIGSKVEVRAREVKSGGESYLTIYECPDCYVKVL